MALTEETEEQLVALLGYIYAAVDWRGMRTSKNPWDIWEHRVRTASTKATLGEFVSRLCALFGVQSLPLAAIELVAALRPDEQAALDLINREHTVLAMRGVMAARRIKAVERRRRRHGNDGDSGTGAERGD